MNEAQTTWYLERNVKNEQEKECKRDMDERKDARKKIWEKDEDEEGVSVTDRRGRDRSKDLIYEFSFWSERKWWGGHVEWKWKAAGVTDIFKKLDVRQTYLKFWNKRLSNEFDW